MDTIDWSSILGEEAGLRKEEELLQYARRVDHVASQELVKIALKSNNGITVTFSLISIFYIWTSLRSKLIKLWFFAIDSHQY